MIPTWPVYPAMLCCCACVITDGSPSTLMPTLGLANRYMTIMDQCGILPVSLTACLMIYSTEISQRWGDGSVVEHFHVIKQIARSKNLFMNSVIQIVAHWQMTL